MIFDTIADGTFDENIFVGQIINNTCAYNNQRDDLSLSKVVSGPKFYSRIIN